MAMMQKAIRVGSSIAAVLPKAFLHDAGIAAGTRISVEAVEGGILVRPVKITGRRARTADDRVAETALGLINRYRNALKRLSDA